MRLIRFIGFWVVTCVITAFASDDILYPGTIHFRDGAVVQLESLYTGYHYKEKRNYLFAQRTLQSPRIKILIEDMAELVVLDDEAKTESRVSIKLKDGQSEVFYLSSQLYPDYVLYDSFTKTTMTDTAMRSEFVKLSWGDEMGDTRINERTGKVWPVDFRYDPFTGEELRLKQSELPN